MNRVAYASALAVVVVLSGCSLIPPLPTPTRTPTSTSTPSSMLGLTRIAPGDRTEPLSLSGTTQDGSAIDISALRGRITVINAWASYCAPCREELPILVALSRAVDSKAITFIGLNVTDDDDEARGIVTEFGVPYPSVVDKTGALLARIPGVPPSALPSTVVLDRQGRIAARIIGAVKPGVLDDVLTDLANET